MITTQFNGPCRLFGSDGARSESGARSPLAGMTHAFIDEGHPRGERPGA